MEATRSGFQFGDVLVRPVDFLVSRGGKPISLEPKSFKVLVYLIENRSRVVTKDELMQAVWNGTAVTDNALTRVIAQLRRELGDDAKQPRYIETVPTVGYRFVADVEESTEPGEIAPAPALKSSIPPAVRRFNPAVLLGAAVIFVAFAVSLFVMRRSDDAQAARPDRLGHIRQFTVSTGVDQHPSFSPDGSSIAFSSDRSGRFEIYVQPLAGGAREIQITSDGQQNLEPSWSPDGQYIAYYSHGKKGLFVIPALGGIARRLTDFGSQPTWSPDGTQIAFRSGPVITLVPIDLAPPTESTIWLVSSKGGSPRQLTEGGPEARHNFPSWSPDGKSVVYSSLLGRSRGIFSIAVSDGTLTRIPSPPGGAFYPIYNARGDGVYFVAPAADGGLSIWKSNVSGGEPQEVLHSGFAFPRELVIDKSGHRLSYTLQSMTSNLYSLDLKTGDSKVLVDDRSFRNTLPMFSPAGDRVAYLVQRFGLPGNIWTMDPDGGNRTRLTQNEKAEWLSGWINGGRGVAFTSMEGGVNNLWTASLADGATAKVTALSRGVWVILSPTGKELVFHQPTNGVTNIWKMDLDTKKSVQLTFDKETMNFPSWSRDGEWMAFETWRGEDSFLSIMDRNGQRYSRLVEQPGHSWPYSWSPDGDRIAFAGMRDAAWNIWWISKSDHSEKKLTDYKSLRSFVRYPAWSPNGERIVYEFAETRGNIFLAELP